MSNSFTDQIWNDPLWFEYRGHLARDNAKERIAQRNHAMPEEWWAAVLEQGPPQDVDWEGLRSD